MDFLKVGTGAIVLLGGNVSLDIEGFGTSICGTIDDASPSLKSWPARLCV